MREKLRGESWEDAKVRALCHFLERRLKKHDTKILPTPPKLE